jgi:RNA recognition motif-containing protein
VKKEDREE